MLIELVNQHDEDKKKAEKAGCDVYAEMTRKALDAFITNEMVADLAIQSTSAYASQHASKAKATGSYQYLHCTVHIIIECENSGHSERYYVNFRASCNSSEIGHEGSVSYIDYKEDTNPVVKENRNFLLGKFMRNMNSTIDTYRKRLLGFIDRLESNESTYNSQIVEIQQTPYLTVEEKTPIIARFEELVRKMRESEIERIRLWNLIQELQDVAKKRYEAALLEWKNKCTKIWRNWVESKFEPWSYRQLTVVPKEISIEISGDDDISEAVGEAMIFIYNVYDGPDEEGYYTELVGAKVQKVKIFGYIMNERPVKHDDPWTGVSCARSVHCASQGIVGAINASFDPTKVPSASEIVYPPCPRLKTFEDEELTKLV